LKPKRSLALPPPAALRDALRTSFRANRRFLVTALLAGVAVCLAMVALAVATGRHPVFFYNEYKEDGNRICGAMTLASSFAMLMGGFLVIMAARQIARWSPGDRAVRWHVTGLGIFYLGLDDLIQFHEWITARFRVKLGLTDFLGLDADLYVYALYGAVGLVLLVRILPDLVAFRAPAFPLAAFVVLMAVSQGIDVVFPWHELSDGQQRVLGPLEEITKALGAWSALLLGVLFLEETVELRTRAAPPAP
jgi:uncharacterized membrane protein